MSPIPWFDKAAIPPSRPASRQSVARKPCPGCRLRHRQRRRVASWTGMSTALHSIASESLYKPTNKTKRAVDKGWKVLTRRYAPTSPRKRGEVTPLRLL